MAGKKADLVKVCTRVASYNAPAGTVWEVSVEEAERLAREGHALPVVEDPAPPVEG